MDFETLTFVGERAEILANADTSKQETKDAAQAWIDTIESTESDDVAQAATDKLLDFLESRMLSIDDLIAFLEGPAAGLFGEEVAAAMLVQQRERKAQGEKYCNCEAHAAAAEILAKFDRI